MSGVTRAGDGSWSWVAPCGASGADNATSRDLTRDAYGAHRKSCLTCGSAQPLAEAAGVVAAAAGGTAVQSRVVKSTAPELEAAPSTPAAPKRGAKKKATPKAAAVASEETTLVTEKLDDAAAKRLFNKILREAEGNEHVAWIGVRKAFPRTQWGKVRDITRQLSEHKTFSAAVASAKKK